MIDFGTAMPAKVTSPCSRVDPQLKQPLRDDLLRHDDFFIRVWKVLSDSRELLCIPVNLGFRCFEPS